MEDVLLKEAEQHGHISEMMAFFQRAYPLVNNDTSLKQMAALGKFFKEYIVDHFQYEEQAIFPRILKAGIPEEKIFIESLQGEHVALLADVHAFDLLFAKAGPDPDPDLLRRLEVSSQKIIARVLRHASREDADLFPLMRKYCL